MAITIDNGDRVIMSPGHGTAPNKVLIDHTIEATIQEDPDGKWYLQFDPLPTKELKLKGFILGETVKLLIRSARKVS